MERGTLKWMPGSSGSEQGMQSGLHSLNSQVIGSRQGHCSWNRSGHNQPAVSHTGSVLESGGVRVGRMGKHQRYRVGRGGDNVFHPCAGRG